MPLSARVPDHAALRPPADHAALRPPADHAALRLPADHAALRAALLKAYLEADQLAEQPWGYTSRLSVGADRFRSVRHRTRRVSGSVGAAAQRAPRARRA